MATSTLLIATVMGLVLVAIVGFVLRLRDWERMAPGLSPRSDALERLVASPATWTVIFVVVALGMTGVTILFVSTEAAFGSLYGLLVYLSFGALLAALLFGGVYAAVKARGGGTSMAVAAGTSIIGLLFLAVVVLQLLLG